MATIRKNNAFLNACVALIVGNVVLLGAAFSEMAIAVEVNSDPATSCEVLHWNRKESAFPYLSVAKPGKYCIDKDYRLSCSEWMGSCGGSGFLEILANDVEVDLQGHTLSRSGRPIEIFGRGRNITIKNGVIENGYLHITTPGSSGFAVGDNFTRIENIRIETGCIHISAANTTIRNSDIAASKNCSTPLTIVGRHPTVEKNRLTTIAGVADAARYGIDLSEGEGAVVRDNTVLNDGPRKNTGGVVLRDSDGAQMEDNRVDNFEQEFVRASVSNGQ